MTKWRELRMKMTASNIGTLLILLLAILFLLHTEVTFQPFSIRFHNWKMVVGIVFVVIGIELIKNDAVEKFSNHLIDMIENGKENRSK